METPDAHRHDDRDSEDWNGTPPELTVHLTLTIGLKEWVGAVPHETWLGDFEIPEADIHDLRTQVEYIVDRPAPGYSYWEERGRTSWGSDGGEMVRAALFVGSAVASGVIGNAAYDLLKKFSRKSATNERRPIDENEAIQRAKWIAITHFSRDVRCLDPIARREEDLTLCGLSSDRETGSWTVSFRGPAGEEYDVQLGLNDLPAATKISWRRALNDQQDG